MSNKNKVLFKRNNPLAKQNKIIITKKENKKCLDYDFNKINDIDFYKKKLENLKKSTKKLFKEKENQSKINKNTAELKIASNFYIKNKIKKFVSAENKNDIPTNIKSKSIFNKSKYLKGFFDKAKIAHFCYKLLKEINI